MTIFRLCLAAFVVAAALVLSGCDPNTPDGATYMMLDSIQRSDLESFGKITRHEAYNEFANEEGMKSLRQTFAGLNDIEVTNVWDQHPSPTYGFRRYVEYIVDVAGRVESKRVQAIRCVVSCSQEFTTPSGCSTKSPTCEPSWLQMECKIVKIIRNRSV